MFWSPLRDEGQITHSRVEWQKSYIHAYKHIYSFWPICILKKGRGISPSVSLNAPSDAIKKEPGHDESHFINTSPPRAAYMSQWIGSALVQIMAWRRIGSAGLLSIGPIGTYCSLFHWSLLLRGHEVHWRLFLRVPAIINKHWFR